MRSKVKEFVTAVREMVDVVGVDHTAIGTDSTIAPTALRAAAANDGRGGRGADGAAGRGGSQGGLDARVFDRVTRRAYVAVPEIRAERLLIVSKPESTLLR